MWSDRPIPGDPWPHDMMITVEDRPSALLELLWVREAHGLEPAGDDLPPLLVDAPAAAARAARTPDERAAWERAWPRVWHEAARHAGREHDPEAFERLHATPHGSPQRLEMLQQLVGPTWRDEFGDDVFDDPSYSAWSERLWEHHLASRPQALEEHPERRDLESLIPAWRRGLTKIVTIPCSGDFVRIITDRALLVTEEIRADSAAYRRALDAFDPSPAQA